ncbi:hypothetical protein HK102_009385 [Quaeritorhiza haematococci]|nr:hypothetical protein HK102_009385 [Quaeritorhiza haematococci]
MEGQLADMNGRDMPPAPSGGCDAADSSPNPKETGPSFTTFSTSNFFSSSSPANNSAANTRSSPFGDFGTGRAATKGDRSSDGNGLGNQPSPFTKPGAQFNFNFSFGQNPTKKQRTTTTSKSNAFAGAFSSFGNVEGDLQGDNSESDGSGGGLSPKAPATQQPQPFFSFQQRQQQSSRQRFVRSEAMLSNNNGPEMNRAGAGGSPQKTPAISVMAEPRQLPPQQQDPNPVKSVDGSGTWLHRRNQQALLGLGLGGNLFRKREESSATENPASTNLPEEASLASAAPVVSAVPATPQLRSLPTQVQLPFKIKKNASIGKMGGKLTNMSGAFQVSKLKASVAKTVEQGSSGIAGGATTPPTMTDESIRSESPTSYSPPLVFKASSPLKQVSVSPPKQRESQEESRNAFSKSTFSTSVPPQGPFMMQPPKMRFQENCTEETYSMVDFHQREDYVERPPEFDSTDTNGTWTPSPVSVYGSNAKTAACTTPVLSSTATGKGDVSDVFPTPPSQPHAGSNIPPGRSPPRSMLGAMQSSHDNDQLRGVRNQFRSASGIKSNLGTSFNMYGMATPTSESHIDLNATGSSLSSSATSTTPSLDRKKRIASVSAADGLGIDGAMGLLGGLAAGCDDADDLAAVMMNIASRMHQKNEDRDKENKQLVADLEVAEETIEKQSATIAKLEENWKRAMVVVSSQRDKVDVNRKRIDKIKQSCKLYQLTIKNLERLIKDVEGDKYKIVQNMDRIAKDSQDLKSKLDTTVVEKSMLEDTFKAFQDSSKTQISTLVSQNESLTSQLGTAAEQSKALTAELAAAREEGRLEVSKVKEEWNQEVARLRNEKELLKEKAAATATETANQVQQLERQAARLRIEVEDFKQRLEKQQVAHDEEITKLRLQHDSEVDERRGVEKRLREEKAGLEEGLGKLKGQLDRVEEAKRMSDESWETMAKQLRGEVEHGVARARDLEKEFDGKRRELEARCNEIEGVAGSLRNKIAELQERLNARNAEYDHQTQTHKAQTEDLLGRIAALQGSLNNEREEREYDRAKFRKEIEAMQSSCDDNVKTIVALRSEHEQQRTSLKQEITNLLKRCDAHHKENLDLRSEHEKERAVLQEKIAKLVESEKTLQSNLATSTTSVEKHKQQIANLQEELTRNASERDALKKTEEELQQKITAVQDELHKERDRLSNLETRMAAESAAKEEAVEKLRKQVDELQAEKVRLESEKIQWENEKKSLTETVSATQNKVHQEKSKEMTKIKSEFQAYMTRMQAEHGNAIHQLNNQIQALKSQKDQLTSSLDKTDSEKAELTKSVEELKGKIRDLQKTTIADKEALEKLQKTIQTSLAEKMALQKSRDTLNNEIDETKRASEADRSKLKELTTEKQALENRIKGLLDQINDLKERSASVVEENSILAAEKKSMEEKCTQMEKDLSEMKTSALSHPNQQESGSVLPIQPHKVTTPTKERVRTATPKSILKKVQWSPSTEIALARSTQPESPARANTNVNVSAVGGDVSGAINEDQEERIPESMVARQNADIQDGEEEQRVLNSVQKPVRSSPSHVVKKAIVESSARRNPAATSTPVKTLTPSKASPAAKRSTPQKHSNVQSPPQQQIVLPVEDGKEMDEDHSQDTVVVVDERARAHDDADQEEFGVFSQIMAEDVEENGDVHEEDDLASQVMAILESVEVANPTKSKDEDTLSASVTAASDDHNEIVGYGGYKSHAPLLGSNANPQMRQISSMSFKLPNGQQQHGKISRASDMVDDISSFATQEKGNSDRKSSKRTKPDTTNNNPKPSPKRSKVDSKKTFGAEALRIPSSGRLTRSMTKSDIRPPAEEQNIVEPYASQGTMSDESTTGSQAKRGGGRGRLRKAANNTATSGKNHRYSEKASVISEPASTVFHSPARKEIRSQRNTPDKNDDGGLKRAQSSARVSKKSGVGHLPPMYAGTSTSITTTTTTIQTTHQRNVHNVHKTFGKKKRHTKRPSTMSLLEEEDENVDAMFDSHW